jgi:1-deoxy-D-xylulose-5-phosphate synthase
MTKKGKGFKEAEMNQTTWHRAPGKFDLETGRILNVNADKPQPPRYQDVFGSTLVELARENEKIVGITPAMQTGSSLNIMVEQMPERTFDVGIAEQHAVTFSAALSKDGMVPFCNIYSSFMQRAYDQVIHDVALQKLHVVFCLDRAGLVGSDGATHHGSFDLAYMRSIPHLTISSPMDEVELRNLMFTAQLPGMGSFVIRYPRGRGIFVNWRQSFREIPVGKGRRLREGDDLAVVTIGHVGNFVQQAATFLEKEHIGIAHYDMRFLRPLDRSLLHEIGQKFKNVITVEDGTIVGGLGTAVMEFMSENRYFPRIKRLGIPDEFIEHGTQDELYHECGYDVQGIIRTVQAMVKPRIVSTAK